MRTATTPVDVLRELVALKDLEDSLPSWPLCPDPDADKRADYERRKQYAWLAARAVVAQHQRK